MKLLWKPNIFWGAKWGKKFQKKRGTNDKETLKQTKISYNNVKFKKKGLTAALIADGEKKIWETLSSNKTWKSLELVFKVYYVVLRKKF